MSATVAAIGYGTTIGFAAPGGSPTFTSIGELLDIKMPKFETDTIEIQRYDSTTLDPELIVSWNRPGELEFTITYSAASAAALWARRGLMSQVLITKPDTKTWTLQGIFVSFADAVPLKDKMTFDVKFKVSGAPVPASTSA